MRDKEIENLIQAETRRQEEGIELIPSENIASPEVLRALGSVFTNKYSEGYPGKRYYGGNEFVDEVELLAQNRAKELFGVPYANVQPLSGSPANLAVYLAVCELGDTVMGLHLPDGGHMTHGWKNSFTGKVYNSVPYHVKADGRIDIDEVRALAKEHKPKLIWAGATAYPREFPFKEFGEIADETGAYLAADIAHIAGLIIAGEHPSPVPFAHIVTTTTHKTLRGPRGGMIFVTEKGLEKDLSLPKKIDSAIIPGIQGGPHDNQTAAIAVALWEAAQPEFKVYGAQVVKNAKVLAEELLKGGVKLISGGTDTHLLLADCGAGRGAIVEAACDAVGMTLNKNTIPNDPASPFYPSGIRLGTPSVTTRGMKEREMKQIAGWIVAVMDEVKEIDLPQNKAVRAEFLTNTKEAFRANTVLQNIREEVRELCNRFPAYPESVDSM